MRTYHCDFRSQLCHNYDKHMTMMLFTATTDKMTSLISFTVITFFKEGVSLLSAAHRDRMNFKLDERQLQPARDSVWASTEHDYGGGSGG